MAADRAEATPLVVDRAALSRSAVDLMDCRRVLACHGALRCAGDHELEDANLRYTARVLDYLGPKTGLVFASSRFAKLPLDAYGFSKRRAEKLVLASAPGRVVVRFGVLVGPSPAGLGRSFLTRMVRDAVGEQVVRLPRELRTVQPMDVRVAATTMWALDPASRSLGTVEAAAEPVSIDELGEMLAARCNVLAGGQVRIERVEMPEASAPHLAPLEPWLKVCARDGINLLPLQATIDDTIAAVLEEAKWNT